MRRDIDEALDGWPYDPDPGTVTARQIRARDGRWVVQVRQELGLIQMESEGRPDGVRPHGFATYLEYLRDLARRGGRSGRGRAKSTARAWTMGAEHRREVDREFVQFHHRRIAWLALHRYDRMLADAEHTLALLDMVGRHCDDPEYVDAHERFRGLVLFHAIQARVAMALENRKPEEAIDALRDGRARIETHRDAMRRGRDDEPDTPDATLLDQLGQIEDEVRDRFGVGKTLREQLDEAIAREDYERAALIRDQLRGRGRR